MKKYENVYMKRFGYFNIYVIKGIDGDILIDTGFIGIKRNLKKWLDNFNIKLIILTHAHVDHIWNTSYLKELYNCEVAIGINDIVNIDNSKICSKPFSKKYSGWTKLMNYGMKKFVPSYFEIDYELEDNDIINKYGLDLKIVELPGHTDGSIGIIYKDYLFCGDALVNRKRVIEAAYQNQNNEKALNSLLKIKDINPKIIFIGHDKEVTYDKYINSIIKMD